MNVLFIPLNQKETRWGLLLVALYFCGRLVLETTKNLGVHCAFLLLVFVAVCILGRRFWRESIFCIRLTGMQMIWKPLLGALGCRALCFLVHDLFMMLGFRYFVTTDWGPVLWNARIALLEGYMQDHFWVIALSIVVLIPILDEFLFRGVILGTLYPKNTVMAVILSVVLFTALNVLPYIGSVSAALGSDAPLYLCLYAFQFIPMGLALAWLYISTDSIFAPILMHIVMNYGLIF